MLNVCIELLSLLTLIEIFGFNSFETSSMLWEKISLTALIYHTKNKFRRNIRYYKLTIDVLLPMMNMSMKYIVESAVCQVTVIKIA